jgi:hypothetical protein
MNSKKMKAFVVVCCVSLIVFSCLTILDAMEPICSARSSCGAHCENYSCNSGRCWAFSGGAGCKCDNLTIIVECGQDDPTVYIL